MLTSDRLEGNPDGAINWMERATVLSPNFAQSYYAQGWTDVMAGRGHEALRKLEKSIRLSPLDPFLYAMQSASGMSYAQEGDYENGAIWADKGARAPRAQFLFGAIAAAVHQMNGGKERAKYWVDNVRSAEAMRHWSISLQRFRLSTAKTDSYCQPH